MRLLLDAHISPAVARELRRREVDAVAVSEWLGGNFRTAPDEQLLAAALSDERVLVTYDLRSIPILLREWTETRQRHGGVVLVDERTIQPNDPGGLVRALCALVERTRGTDWLDRVIFLRRR